MVDAHPPTREKESNKLRELGHKVLDRTSHLVSTSGELGHKVLDKTSHLVSSSAVKINDGKNLIISKLVSISTPVNFPGYSAAAKSLSCCIVCLICLPLFFAFSCAGRHC